MAVVTRLVQQHNTLLLAMTLMASQYTAATICSHCITRALTLAAGSHSITLGSDNIARALLLVMAREASANHSSWQWLL